MEGSGDKGHANFRKALAIFRKHFDDNHPSVQWILGWMKSAGCTP
jgi:TPR repeat protein